MRECTHCVKQRWCSDVQLDITKVDLETTIRQLLEIRAESCPNYEEKGNGQQLQFVCKSGGVF